MSKIFTRVIILAMCLECGLEAAAQLVNRATFEQHRAKAHALYGTLRTASASSPITLSQNPYEIEEFTLEPGNSSAQVKVYFNTAVMASYRNIKITTPYSVFNASLREAYSRDLRIAGIILRPKELAEFEESNK